MKIGIFGKNARQGASLGSLVDEVLGYEEQGFGSYWMQQASTFHALTMMGLIGHCTSKIELGIATIPTYPRHPGALLHQAWTVNVLAGGRLVLGIGPTAEPEYETLGSSYDESVRHIRDYVSIAEELGESDDAELRCEKLRVMSQTVVVTWMVKSKNHPQSHGTRDHESSGRC